VETPLDRCTGKGSWGRPLFRALFAKYRDDIVAIEGEPSSPIRAQEQAHIVVFIWRMQLYGCGKFLI
jgi:hypothetical protein